MKYKETDLFNPYQASSTRAKALLYFLENDNYEALKAYEGLRVLMNDELTQVITILSKYDDKHMFDKDREGNSKTNPVYEYIIGQTGATAFRDFHDYAMASSKDTYGPGFSREGGFEGLEMALKCLLTAIGDPTIALAQSITENDSEYFYKILSTDKDYKSRLDSLSAEEGDLERREPAEIFSRIKQKRDFVLDLIQREKQKVNLPFPQDFLENNQHQNSLSILMDNPNENTEYAKRYIGKLSAKDKIDIINHFVPEIFYFHDDEQIITKFGAIIDGNGFFTHQQKYEYLKMYLIITAHDHSIRNFSHSVDTGYATNVNGYGFYDELFFQDYQNRLVDDLKSLGAIARYSELSLNSEVFLRDHFDDKDEHTIMKLNRSILKEADKIIFGEASDSLFNVVNIEKLKEFLQEGKGTASLYYIDDHQSKEARIAKIDEACQCLDIIKNLAFKKETTTLRSISTIDNSGRS